MEIFVSPTKRARAATALNLLVGYRKGLCNAENQRAALSVREIAKN